MSHRTRLSVNVNKIAVLRNSRGHSEPDVIRAASACIDAGAHGITVHPRPDARHIRHDDVIALSALTRARGVEFNIEGNPFAAPRAGYAGLVALCRQTLPDQVTLVPDGDQQMTSDHGFDFVREGDALCPLISELKRLGCRVSVFADVNAPRLTDAAIWGRTGLNCIPVHMRRRTMLAARTRCWVDLRPLRVLRGTLAWVSMLAMTCRKPTWVRF